MSETAPFVPPPGSENEDRGPGFRGFLIFLTILSVGSITLRLWSRSLNTDQGEGRRRFWWDDWLAIASVPFTLAQLIISFVLLNLGVGRHIWAVKPENIEPILKLLWAVFLVYGFALTLTKASALCFLSRIFPRHASTTWFNSILWFAHGLNALWLIAYTFVEIFQCKPVEHFWKPLEPGTCMRQNRIYIGATVPSVIIDLLILLLPLGPLWNLRTSTARKAGILLVFILGYSVVVVSTGRLVAALKGKEAFDRDLTYEGVSSFYWGVAEAPITLFSICFPAMLTLGRRMQATYISPLASKLSSVVGSRSVLLSRSGNNPGDPASYHSRKSDRSRKKPKQGLTTMELASVDSMETGSQRGILNLSPVPNQYGTKIQVGNSDGGEVPQQSIRVDKDITVSHKH